MLRSVNSSIICVIDDFNSIRVVSKRKGIGNVSVNNCDIVRFKEFIEKCDLKDILSMERKYIWYKANRTVRSRLDRAIVFDEWLIQ